MNRELEKSSHAVIILVNGRLAAPILLSCALGRLAGEVLVELVIETVGRPPNYRIRLVVPWKEVRGSYCEGILCVGHVLDIVLPGQLNDYPGADWDVSIAGQNRA
ncbi:hypothetical protein ACFUTX_08890 [Microbacterium sp. NPDC057407]|uniref:hypothetical protein n=1 Tax=Microbacterium sp. NPDC057407 TaxID=3346120 RepID=UPI00366FCFB6